MKIGWLKGGSLLASKDGEHWRDVSAVLKALPAPTIWDGPSDWFFLHYELAISLISQFMDDAPSVAVDENSAWLSPVLRPSKIVGIPVNYHDHIDEVEKKRSTFSHRYTGSIRDQGFFMKAASSLVGAAEGVTLRFLERETHHELELAVIIGQRADRVSQEEALQCIAGYCIALDMVVRGPEDRSMRKSIDSYSVLGPWLTTVQDIAAVESLHMTLAVNGERRQSCYPRDMIMGIAEQIAWISESCALLPGDVIMTGTAAGVSRVQPGDDMDCAIEGLGQMRVSVRAA